MPNMDQLVRDKGQVSVPSMEQSAVANQMLKQMDKKGGDSYGIIAVFNSGSKKALTSKQKEQIASVINELKAKKKQLGITNITSHLDSSEMAKQLVSKDYTTILTQLSVDKKQGTISEIAKKINQVVETKAVKTYLTGSELINNDFASSTQDGVKKTELIAIIFILVVLIIVFRSPIVPIISILTVGVSFMVSWGIIAQLVDKFNFPFSSFTEVFLVVVLFGIGTDYNILLYTRFKEELSKLKNAYLATKETFKSAGKTVLFSGMAVLIGFASLFLAKFSLYQATAVVAIGVATLLIVLTTLNPFFMALLGKWMFYPVKHFEGHGDSRLWGFLAKNSVARPIISVILALILCVPFILSYSNKLNFNSLLEVNNKYPSKQGITVIEDHFPPGFSSPATLVIQSDKKLDQASFLKILDELTQNISTVKGVSEVMSPTRPTGEKIKGLYINQQAQQLNTGIGSANKGVGQVNQGLTSANNQIAQNSSNGLANVQQLINGTNDAKNGVSALGDAINKVTAGINSGAIGAQQLQSGLASLNANVNTLSSAVSQLYTGYSQLQQGLSSYDQYFGDISQTMNNAMNGPNSIESSIKNLISKDPQLASDPNVQQIVQLARSSKNQLNTLLTQFNQFSTQYQSAMTKFKEANNSLAKVNDGLVQMKNGVTQLQKGATDLKNGLNQGANGSAQIASKTVDLQSGLAQINNGQKQLLNGLNNLQAKMGQLQSGLSASTQGLDKVSSGLNDAQNYLSGLSQSKSSETFYIPKDVLKSKSFQDALNTYMSSDRKIAKMTIILNVNPYSEEAMPIIQNINKQVAATLSGTDFKNAKVAIGGTTANNADLKDVSQKDFLRIATIMLIGIALALIVITRSVSRAIFIVGSLVLSYFAALGISQLISSHVLHEELLSWNAPFFSFIMIVALGVDYSIFLMMRYNELEGDIATRIVDASRHIGGVVLSAALILGGTFAALIPSGVLTLIQVATVVIVGLLLLSLIAMPILLPGLMGLTNKLNSFRKK